METRHSSILLIVFAGVAAPACFADEKLDTAPIVSALIDVAKDADESVRYAAFNALKTQPRSDELLELFWRGLDDESPNIRLLSLDKVVELEGPTEKLLERLVVLANAPKHVDVFATEMGRRVQSHLIAIGEPGIPYLIEALQEDEARYIAMSALGQIPLGKHRSTVASHLTALLKDEDKSVRIAAVQSLEKIMSAAAKSEAISQRIEAQGDQGDHLPRRYLAYYEKVLQKYDSNKDGSLTKDEWTAMSKDPAAADEDGDGRITLLELAKWSMRRSSP